MSAVGMNVGKQHSEAMMISEWWTVICFLCGFYAGGLCVSFLYRTRRR